MMKKKLLSLVLTIALLCGGIPLHSMAAETYLWPVPGHTNIFQAYSGKHLGIDITDGSIAGANVVATKSGTVQRYWNECQHLHSSGSCQCSVNTHGYGNGIVLTHPDGTYSYYAHLAYNSIPSQYRSPGAYVSRGAVIGQVGSSGLSTGYHLHFALGTNYWNADTYSVYNVNPQSVGYDYGGAPAGPNITFTGITSGSLQDVGDYKADANIDAYFHTNGSTVSHVGFYLWDTATGTLVDRHIEETGEFASIPIIKGTFALRSECGIDLKTGTGYTYQMIAIVDGKEYLSEKSTFQTSGSALSKPGSVTTILNKQEFTVGEIISVSCSGGTGAEYFNLVMDGTYVMDAAGNPVKSATGQFTVSDVSSGSHRIHVRAWNSAGSTDGTIVNFTVNEDKPSGPDPYPGTPFIDITNHWGRESIKWAYTQSLFSGASETRFDPEGKMNRGMLATVLYRMAGSPAVSGNSRFPDVPENAYYSKAAAWTANKGIVQGSDGKFLPNSNITREQLAAMLYRYAKLYGDSHKMYDWDTLVQFSDNDKISSYARESMCWAVETGVITGKGDRRLDPKGSATRAEVATMLRRYAS